MISNQPCNTHWNSHTRISAALLDLLLSYVFKSVEVKSKLTYVELLSVHLGPTQNTIHVTADRGVATCVRGQQLICGPSGFWKFPCCSNYALGLKVHTYFVFGGKSGVIQELKTNRGKSGGLQEQRTENGKFGAVQESKTEEREKATVNL